MLKRTSNTNQYNIYIIAPLDFKEDISSIVAQHVATHNWNIDILRPLDEFIDNRTSR
jgi:hypothetical protein